MGNKKHYKLTFYQICFVPFFYLYYAYLYNLKIKNQYNIRKWKIQGGAWTTLREISHIDKKDAK